MTNELAIRILTGDVIGTSEQTQEAITMAVRALSQPEPSEDAVSREAVSSWLKQYGQDVLHGKKKFSLMYIWKNLMDLPSTQPEIIRCKDCKHWKSNEFIGNNDVSTINLQSYPCKFGITDAEWFCGSAERRQE